MSGGDAPRRPAVVVVRSPGDSPSDLLARARVGLRQAGVHHREVEEITARVLSIPEEEQAGRLAEEVTIVPSDKSSGPGLSSH